MMEGRRKEQEDEEDVYLRSLFEQDPLLERDLVTLERPLVVWNKC